MSYKTERHLEAFINAINKMDYILENKSNVLTKEKFQIILSELNVELAEINKQIPEPEQEGVKS